MGAGWPNGLRRGLDVNPHRCQHGLDLRKHARCYLCDPEPRPLVFPVTSPAIQKPCTCPLVKPGDMYVGDVFCERHFPGSTNTGMTT